MTASINSSADLLLVDTNIFIYSIDRQSEQKRQLAIEVLDRLRNAGAGAISTQIVGEFVNGATKRRGPNIGLEEALSRASDFMATFEVFGITAAITIEAMRGASRFRFAYWDAQLWATAFVNGIPVVLTEDFQSGGSFDGVRFVNPFDPGFDFDAVVGA